MPASGPLISPSAILTGSYSTAIAQGSPGGLPIPTLDMVGKYARCTDLFGNKVDLVLCSQYGSNFFWQPVRPQWPNTSALSANADMTLYPLRTPTMLRFTGAMTGNRVITPDKTLAYPGLTYQIKMDGTLNLFTLTLAGLALGNVLSLALNTTRTIYFDGTDFQQIG